MLYLGLDVHSKWFTLAGFVKETGECLKIAKVLNDPTAIAETFATLPTPRAGALESGTHAVAMHRLLQPYFDRLIIVAPNQVWDRRRDTGAKTDARDAYGQAEALAQGRLRPIYLPDDTLSLARTGMARNSSAYGCRKTGRMYEPPQYDDDRHTDDSLCDLRAEING